MSSDHAVLIDGLVKQYGIFKRVRALDSVNLCVEKGDIFALIGPNGAGKTTLMGCMLALLRPTQGSIRILGQPADSLAVRRVTGFLPERPSFETWMSAAEFLQYHLMLSERSTINAKKEIKETLEFVGLEDVASRPLSKFSRGMLQRVGLAQLLIGKPQICFLDEPTSGMDPPGMDLVRRVLVRLRDEGATAVVNSHHLDEVARVCNRFAFMRKGKIEVHQEVDALNSRLLVVRFAKDLEAAPSIERIEQIVAPLNIQIKDSTDDQCKLVLPSRASAPAVIKVLVDADVAFEEAFFERSNLLDLFSESSE
jgi:ABC-2 type transport system ATP-binding protein